jgi:hypothetical protein
MSPLIHLNRCCTRSYQFYGIFARNAKSIYEVVSESSQTFSCNCHVTVMWTRVVFTRVLYQLCYWNPSNVSWGFRTFFKPDSGFWMAFTFQGWLSVRWRWWTFRAIKYQQNGRKHGKNSRTYPRGSLTNNPRTRRHWRDTLWSLPGDVIRIFERALQCHAVCSLTFDKWWEFVTNSNMVIVSNPPPPLIKIRQ